MSFVDILNTIWPILVALLLFCVIITIHEFGHFIFAKIFKVKVNEFAVGFGPAIFKKQKGETLYALRILPIGGYCAMEGEDTDSDDDRAFFRAKVWKRIIIVAAGAIFNIILGFIIMAIIVGCQPTLSTNVVAKFDDKATSNTGKSALMVDDEIININGRGIYSPDDISYMLATDTDGIVKMVVKRGNEKIILDDVRFKLTEVEGSQIIELDFWVKGEQNNFGLWAKQSFMRTVSMGRMVWMSFIDLCTGKYGINELSGPVGVTKIISDAVSGVTVDGMKSLLVLMRILCMITVNLGVFNLLPIPALDGSRILFLAIEGVRKKPVKNEALIHTIGMSVLLIFMAIIIVKDLYQWIW